MFERREDEAKEASGIAGKLQESVNQIVYKSKYEDTQKRLTLQQEEFNKKMKTV